MVKPATTYHRVPVRDDRRDMTCQRGAIVVILVCGAVLGTLSSSVAGQDAPVETGPVPVLSVHITSEATSVINEPFDVLIEFARPVTGFELSDLHVANGAASDFEGSGSSYRAVITPERDGSVVIRIPANAGRDDAGRGNIPSSAFMRTTLSPGTAARLEAAAPWINTWDRAAVVSGYVEEFERTEPDSGYTGHVATCVAGTTDQAFRDSLLQRLNWFRRMAGLDLVAERRSHTREAQFAALIMAGQGQLSHSPPESWPCYTAQGYRGASRSNLHFRQTTGVWTDHEGVAALDSYMLDHGPDNTGVGHRRWMLSPFLGDVGFGKAYADQIQSDALHVVGSLRRLPGDTRDARDVIAWPPPGYVPAATVWQRWSFALPGRADFTSATVAVVGEDGPLGTTVVHRDDRQSRPTGGIAAIVWELEGIGEYQSMRQPDAGDQCYVVTVSGVRLNTVVQDPYEYSTCVLDLDVRSLDSSGLSGLEGLYGPQSLESSRVTENSVTLSWGLVAQPTGVTVEEYVVERPGEWGWSTVHGSAEPFTSYTIEGLSPDTEYRFRVRLATSRGSTVESIQVTTTPEPSEVDTRIVARRLTGGRTEFALQQRGAEGEWNDRQLPRARFLPADARTGRWLASTPVEVTAESSSAGDAVVQVRIAARRLAGGRIEFALQRQGEDGGWDERRLPQVRFLSSRAGLERWLVSSPLTVTTAQPAPRAPSRIVTGTPLPAGPSPRSAAAHPLAAPDTAESGGTFVAVAAGREFSCALRVDGSVTCWGRNEDAQLQVPDGPFTEVSAGSRHACALRTDGTVACWGDNDDGQAHPASGEFSSVGAGASHSCGLRVDGTITCWGGNDHGQLSAPKGHFSTITVGEDHACALSGEESVSCWGRDTWRQSDPPSGKFSTVAAGSSHTCGLRDDDTVVCWGSNWLGQLDVPGGNFTTIAAGNHFTCGLSPEHAITCWGSDRFGRLDAPHGSFSALALGVWHGCAVLRDGAIACWGYSTSSAAAGLDG